MLYEFLALHRETIIARTRSKVAARPAPIPTDAVLEHGVPLFLDQLVGVLRREQETAGRPSDSKIGKSASRHGADQRRAGFTVGQVVHGYGDVCQAVTELAVETEVPISADEFRTLNRCLDDAIAEAVTEYARAEIGALADAHTVHLGSFAHELRNLLTNAMLAYDVLKSGTVGMGGSTGALLGRNLTALRALIDIALSQARLQGGVHRRLEVPLGELVEDVALPAAIQATSLGLVFTVTPLESGTFVHVDRQLVVAALTNIVQNALKFSRVGGQIILRTDSRARPDCVLIEVEDECGGLPAGEVENLFLPFEQRGPNRTGLGLGLTISKESIEANGGTLHVRSLPGQGCVFTVELPLLRRDAPTDPTERRNLDSTGG
jgi:signal transduction histidine kinase